MANPVILSLRYAYCLHWSYYGISPMDNFFNGQWLCSPFCVVNNSEPSYWLNHLYCKCFVVAYRDCWENCVRLRQLIIVALFHLYKHICSLISRHYLYKFMLPFITSNITVRFISTWYFGCFQSSFVVMLNLGFCKTRTTDLGFQWNLPGALPLQLMSIKSKTNYKLSAFEISIVCNHLSFNQEVR